MRTTLRTVPRKTGSRGKELRRNYSQKGQVVEHVPRGQARTSKSRGGIGGDQPPLWPFDAGAQARDQLAPIFAEVQRLANARRRARRNRCPIVLVFHTAGESALHRQVRLQESPRFAV